MSELAAKFRADEEGASLIEYSLLIGLISITILTAITAISGNMAVIWSDVQSAMAVAAG